jgi:hypothetical protein
MVEMAELFRLHGPQYRAKFGDQMPQSHLRAMEAIAQCRTEALGGQVYYCENCHDYQYSYHSCKNRHCPKCQNGSANEWLQRQTALLLPGPHCLVTFTLPDALRALSRSQQQLFSNSLFRSSAQALQDLALDPRFVGGKIGMVGVWHTWTRALHYHPHVPYRVPAGGLAADGRQWLPSRENFLVPVKALSLLFRANVRDALRKTPVFDLVPNDLWAQDWVVHCEPVGSGSHALHDVAPYIFRVALSNNRLLKRVDGPVTFQYPDSQTRTIKVCTVAAEACIRRFLQHVLPDHLVKVRYDSLFGPGNRDDLKKARQLLGVENRNRHPAGHESDAPPPETAIRCPKCASVMQLIETLRPNGWFPLTRGP